MADVVNRRFAVVVLKTKAMFWIVLNLPAIMKKRAFVQTRTRKISDAQVMKFMIKADLKKKARFGSMVRHFGVEQAIRWYTRPEMMER